MSIYDRRVSSTYFGFKVSFMTMETKEQIVSLKVIEDGVKKTIRLRPEHIDMLGRAHVSHINSIQARLRDKKPKDGVIDVANEEGGEL